MESDITCLVDQKSFNKFFVVLHIIVATIFIILLKNTRPITLTLLLTVILGYIIYSEKSNLPIYLLPSLGITIWLLDICITSNTRVADLQNMISNEKVLENNVWKIPYWSIASYYIVLLGMYIKQ
jgi:hypothetical protein